MKWPAPFRMPTECWVLLVPGFLAGALTGCGVADWYKTIEEAPGFWISSVLAVTAVILVRSLLLEAIGLLDPDEADFGYDTVSILKRVVLIQVPMFVAGALLAFSGVLVVGHMPSDVRWAFTITIGVFIGVGRLVDLGREIAGIQLAVATAVLAMALLFLGDLVLHEQGHPSALRVLLPGLIP